MKRTVGRRLEALEATYKRLKRMPDLFEPGRGTEVHVPVGAEPAPRRRADRIPMPVPRERRRAEPLCTSARASGYAPDPGETGEIARLVEANDLVRGYESRVEHGAGIATGRYAAEAIDAFCFLWQIVRDLDAYEPLQAGRISLRAHVANRVVAATQLDVEATVDATLHAVVPLMDERGVRDAYVERLVERHGVRRAFTRGRGSASQARGSSRVRRAM